MSSAYKIFPGLMRNLGLGLGLALPVVVGVISPNRLQPAIAQTTGCDRTGECANAL
jgi:hypothetical protein